MTPRDLIAQAEHELADIKFSVLPLRLRDMTNVVDMSHKQKFLDAWRKQQINRALRKAEDRTAPLATRADAEAATRHAVACLYGAVSAECAERHPRDERAAKNAAVHLLEMELSNIMLAVTGGKQRCGND